MELNKQVTTGSLLDKVKQFVDFQKNAREQQAQDFWQKRTKQQQDLYTSWLSSTNPEISKQCTKAVRVGQIAEWIRDYFSKPENWWEDYSNIEDVPLVDNYINLNPDRKVQLYDYVLEDNQICDPTQLYTDMGWIQEPEKESSTLSNVVWWAYDSATWIPRMLAKWTANAIGWVAKQFWADDDKVNSLVNDYKNYLDSDWSGEAIWADKDSWTYKGTKMVWDLAQTAAYGWLAKAWVQSALWGYPLVTKATPLWVKAAVWAIEWAADMWIYDMVSESELPSGKDLALWATLWAVAPVLWAVWKATGKALKTWAKSTAAKLELSWMLNPAKLTEVKNRLIDEWVDIAWAWLKKGSAEDVGTWMIERWMQWDKPTIINKLWEHATKARQMKLDTLWKSTTLNEIPSANESLKLIYDTISDVPWLEKTTQRVSELMWKDKFTWKEADEIKTILDDTFSIFTNAWDVKAWAVKKWLANVRRELKVAIEEWAKREWLWDIKMLNNEIQIAKWLKDWISKKDSADVAREMLSVFSKPALWAVFWASSPVGVFDNSSFGGRIWNAILWALAGKYLFSTEAKTALASKLNKLSWGSKKELERLVAWESIELSNKTQKELLDILQDVEALPISTTEAIPSEEAEAMAKYVQLSLFD